MSIYGAPYGVLSGGLLSAVALDNRECPIAFCSVLYVLAVGLFSIGSIYCTVCCVPFELTPN